MKAARISKYGDVSVVKIEQVGQPAPGDNQILIKVYASSINPFDAKLRAGVMKDFIPLKFPATLGGDVAGTVEGMGEKVTGLKVGDKVYGQAAVVAGNSGAFAEFAVTDFSQVAKMPKNLDFKQAASLPLVGASALQVIKNHINLKRGQKLFVHGGAGGIGSIAIQIAKHLGAYVATTATGDGINFVKSLGADEVIDYKVQDFAATLSGYDAVFDTVGGDDFNKSLDILKHGGTAVSMIAKANEAKAERLGVLAITQGTKVNTHDLGELAKLVEAGVVTPQVAEVYKLDDIAAAFAAYESGQVKGKVVVEVESA